MTEPVFDFAEFFRAHRVSRQVELRSKTRTCRESEAKSHTGKKKAVKGPLTGRQSCAMDTARPARKVLQSSPRVGPLIFSTFEMRRLVSRARRRALAPLSEILLFHNTCRATRAPDHVKLRTASIGFAACVFCPRSSALPELPVCCSSPVLSRVPQHRRSRHYFPIDRAPEAARSTRPARPPRPWRQHYLSSSRRDPSETDTRGSAICSRVVQG